MTKKHKGNKHEEARKAVPTSAARASSKAAKLTRQAEPPAAEPPGVEKSSQVRTRLFIQSDESESGPQGTLSSFEIQMIDSLEGQPETRAVEVVTDTAPPFPELYLPMINRWDEVQASDWDPDFVYKCAEEQVALAMLEAEQAAALCEWCGAFPSFLYSEDSLGLARPHPFVPGSVSEASVASMDSASEDGPFAFDHI